MIHIACAPQMPAFTLCLPNPDGRGREQRERSLLERLKSCCALEIETLGAAMSKSLWQLWWLHSLLWSQVAGHLS